MLHATYLQVVIADKTWTLNLYRLTCIFEAIRSRDHSSARKVMTLTRRKLEEGRPSCATHKVSHAVTEKRRRRAYGVHMVFLCTTSGPTTPGMRNAELHRASWLRLCS